jgi:putative two-component system response regulator
MVGTRKKPRILLVDYEEKDRRLISEALKSLSCLIDAVKDGRDAVPRALSFKPDLIFLGRIPAKDGWAACRLLKDNPETKGIPIVIITATNDKDTRLKALEAGASDFLTTPIDSTDVMIRTRNLLRIKEYEDFLRDHQGRIEAETKKKTAALKAALKDVVRSQQRLKANYQDTICRLITVAEFKDEGAASHVRRVGLYCAHFAKQLGWDNDRVEMIKNAASMHDIGNIGIPSDVLLKPTRLTPEELALVKTHTIIGGKILQGSESDLLRMAEIIAVNHHERWDGTGYPSGLRGEKIPIEGRIAAFADQYDALRSIRPYKPHYDYVKAYRIIVEGNDRMGPRHFDPQLLEIFKDTHKALENIYDLDQDLSRYDRIKTLKPFILLEPDKIYALIAKMTERTYAYGENIIVQGEKGDHCYYIIKSGRVAVFRKGKGASEEEQVDLLSEGDGFGEEALIQDEPRRATCRALEETVVYALDKADFNDIMKASFLKNIFAEDMSAGEHRDKYVMIDTRVSHEYEQEHIEGAVNIPVEDLRRKYAQLDPAKAYVTYCTHDARGLISAFLLKNHGFNAKCLRGGISSWTGPTVSASDAVCARRRGKRKRGSVSYRTRS